jgi:hypothetical protein
MKESLISLFLLGCCVSHSPLKAQAYAPSLSCEVLTIPQQQNRRVTLSGRVMDARTGEPIAKVRVIVHGTDQTTTTDESGVFALDDVPTGKVDLYITTVTYGLVKKTITVKEGKSQTFEIALNEDAAALTEHVTIAPDPYETTQSGAVSEQTLTKRELQGLSSILLGDPLRSAQALPGAVGNDDFRSEFSVRGAGFERVGVYLDDVLTDNFVHTVAGGYPDTGSLSVINADTISSVSLLSGAFPSKFGHRTAAVLNLESRDGNRVKPSGRIAAALSGISGIVDGPFADTRGSYLFAARKSYIGYLVRRINDENQLTNNPPVLNFADAQGKVVYDLTKRSQVGLSIIYGAFDYDRNRDRDLLFINAVFRGNSRNLLVNGHWSYTSDQRVYWQTRFFGLRTNFRNVNRDELILNDGNRSQFGARSDLAVQLPNSHRLEAGLYVRSLRVQSQSQRFGFLSEPFDFGSFKRKGIEQAYYAQDTWTSEQVGLTLTGGLRVDYSGLTQETLFSPRFSFNWSITNDWRLRGGAGRHFQFPDFEQMFGRLGNPNLRAERSDAYNASIERVFGNRVRVIVEVYDREDADLFFSLYEPRLDGTGVTFAEFPFQNALRGHARGIEFAVQRRSANKLSGWISYAYSRTRLTDTQNGLTFIGDSNQLHTVNVYGSYRFNDTWNLSGAWRFGSGQPVPGFFRQVGTDYFLSHERNLARLPRYSRIDLRASKAFALRNWKLTVTGEVLNLLNRNNVRYAGFDGFDLSNGRVFGQLDRVLPILPSAGVVLEF